MESINSHFTWHWNGTKLIKMNWPQPCWLQAATKKTEQELLSFGVSELHDPLRCNCRPDGGGVQKICGWCLEQRAMKVIWEAHVSVFRTCWPAHFFLKRSPMYPVGFSLTELHGLSNQFIHSRSWKSCAFLFVSEFMVKIHNSSVPGSFWIHYPNSLWLFW